MIVRNVATLGISVVIPTCGRLMMLESLLESLDGPRAEYAGPCQVIILDNTPLSGREALRTMAEAHGVEYSVGSDNLSVKRNQGIAAAKHEVVLFLDSDCTATPGLLVAHANAYTDPLVVGCLGVVDFVGPDSLIWRAVETTGVLECFRMPFRQHTTLWGPTANVSFRKASLQRIGGFDSAFVRPGGEDVDLGFRLHDLGGTLLCSAEAVAFHSRDTWSSPGSIIRRFLAYGQADALLIRKHPGRSVIDLPTQTHLLLMVTSFSLATAAVSGSRAILFLTPIWAVLSLAACAAIAPATWRVPSTHASRASVVLGVLLLSVLDAGRLVGGFRHGVRRALYCRIIFSDDQQILDWPSVARDALTGLFSLALALIAVTILHAVE